MFNKRLKKINKKKTKQSPIIEKRLEQKIGLDLVLYKTSQIKHFWHFDRAVAACRSRFRAYLEYDGKGALYYHKGFVYIF